MVKDVSSCLIYTALETCQVTLSWHCIVIYLPTKHLGTLKNSFLKCPCVPDPTGIWKCRFLRTGQNRITRRKNPHARNKGENQQQIQPTYGVDASILTRGTLVGGECCHYCTTLVPQSPSLGLISFFECTLEKKAHYSLTHCLCSVFYTTCETNL